MGQGGKEKLEQGRSKERSKVGANGARGEYWGDEEVRSISMMGESPANERKWVYVVRPLGERG